MPEFEGRIGKQLRERWNHELRPDINKQGWTHEEERHLVKAHREVGNSWAEIAKVSVLFGIDFIEQLFWLLLVFWGRQAICRTSIFYLVFIVATPRKSSATMRKLLKQCDEELRGLAGLARQDTEWCEESLACDYEESEQSSLVCQSLHTLASLSQGAKYWRDGGSDLGKSPSWR